MKEKNCIKILSLLLLAVILLSGTSAAMHHGIVFVYQNGTSLPDGTWTNGASMITVEDGDILPLGDFTTGTYKIGDQQIYVSYPTASYSAIASIEGVDYLVEDGGIVYKGSTLSLDITSATDDVPVTDLVITHPNGAMFRMGTVDYEFPADMETGTYKVQAIFDTAYFVPGVPVDIMLDRDNSLSFTVIEETAATISASVNAVYNGDAVAVTVTGMPGREYTMELLGFDIVENQIPDIRETETPNQYSLTMWNTGKATFIVTADTTDSTASIELIGVENGKIVITVVQGQSIGGGGVVTPNSTIPSTPVPSTLVLQNGWNFISVPKALAASANTASSVFSNVDTADRAILAYSASGEQWGQVTTGTVIKPLTGYWVYSNGGVVIPLSYSTDPSVPAVKQLYAGWNAVGVSAHEAVTAATVFSGTSWRVALPWDLTRGSFGSAIVNGAGSSNSDEQYMTLGNGVWLYVDTNGTMIGLTA